jgi:type III secretory pathway component EscU
MKTIFWELQAFPFYGSAGVFDILGPMVKDVAKVGIFTSIVMAMVDYTYQKNNWKKQFMMSKDKAKRDYQKSEGDGQMKNKRKQIHNEMMEEDSPPKTKQASALVKNPEYRAIALLYDFQRQVFSLLIFLAKGIGIVAEKMTEVAKAESICIMRNVALGHALVDLEGVMEHRLVGKYVRQPRVTRMCRTFIHKNCLSSDVISIASTYFLNSVYPSLKYGIQFLFIQTPQTLLQALKKLILVSHLNPFEFFFNCRKQVEVTRGQIRRI